MIPQPSVSIVIPTYNEERHLRTTLDSVARQTYDGIVEVLVVDGRSTDSTRVIAASYAGVRIVDNPARLQSAGLNHALDAATGDVVVRVDGHCVLADDYVECCVDALFESGAAMVGGAMTPDAHGGTQRAIATAMASRVGAGPARFHGGGRRGWVDTVYLGAFRLEDARAVGGYSEDVGVNEDSEFAIRLGARGGVWFDPAIRSRYTPRADVAGVVRQFYRYGLSRAATVKRHPRTLRPRQLVAPALVLGLASPWRRQVAAAYGTLVVAQAARRLADGVPVAAATAAVLPAMHFSWGIGFLAGLAGQSPPRGVAPVVEGDPSHEVAAA
jgi:glycosyltransferase involved in cell wall biosynthesis